MKGLNWYFGFLKERKKEDHQANFSISNFEKAGFDFKLFIFTLFNFRNLA